MPDKSTSSKTSVLFAAITCIAAAAADAKDAETLPRLKSGLVLRNFEDMWRGFDPRAEPLEVEQLKEWEQDGVSLRVVRFRIGVFKGRKAKLAAIYGFPKNATVKGRKLPGLLQIHGGGQYADYRACLANAKRGYATVSIAWAGRINAPGYRVTPKEVKLFWDGKTKAPGYRLTTDWGALDGYHAPGRNRGNVFPSVKAAAWTLDPVESPRNSGWFLCALAARRALTFLEKQPEVDPKRLGVYGHSMGGKLTVMTAVDKRVKAAAPSCGGISDRYNRSPRYRATLGDNISLAQITCPIIFLSPANDFHGRIGDLPATVKEIKSKDWRVTCSPHHNHQDTPSYEVATLLWFDQQLKKSFAMPKTPATELKLKTSDSVPTFTVMPDSSQRILSVDVYYTQHGKANETPNDRIGTMHRFWHYAKPVECNGSWTTKLPLNTNRKPLWVFANVRYPLKKPVTGVGYYYGSYTAKSFNLSSVVKMVPSGKLLAAGVKATRKPSLVIEDFKGDWEKEWFTYRPAEWARTTHKINDATWLAPPRARLSLEVLAEKPNKLVIRIEDHVAQVSLTGGNKWQAIQLTPAEFRNRSNQPLADWKNIKRLKLSHAERLRPGRREKGQAKVVGGRWKGPAPHFRNLRWHLRK